MKKNGAKPNKKQRLKPRKQKANIFAPLAGIRFANLLLLAIAGIINAFGITMFLAPVGLYDSGISGMSMLLSQLTPEFFTLSIFLIVLNMPLFIYGCKKQGILFTLYALYTILFYSLGAWLFACILPKTATAVSPIAGGDLLLCSVFGGVISGVGSGLAIRFGGAMDGIDVMAVIFAKRIGISVGTFVMIFNVVLYVIAGIVTKSFILPLYSVVAYAVGLKVVDFIVEGFDRSKAAMIVTTCPDRIAYELSDAFETGITILDGKGYYSDSKKSILYIVINRFQVGTLKQVVHKCDPLAFITITEAADVFSANMDKTK